MGVTAAKKMLPLRTFTAFTNANPANSNTSEDDEGDSSGGSSSSSGHRSKGGGLSDGGRPEAADAEQLVNRGVSSRLVVSEGRPDVQQIISEKCSSNTPTLVCVS